MKKKILIGLVGVLVIGLWSSISFVRYRRGREPDGFRGIKWETDISTLKNMEYYGTLPDYGGVKFYTKKNEDLHIGEVKLRKITYNFWRGKFFSVSMVTQGRTNWTSLKNAVFEKFGIDYQPDEFIERYDWKGNIISIFLYYNKVSEEGEFCMFSKEICKQQRAYEKQKAEEGAKTGF